MMIPRYRLMLVREGASEARGPVGSPEMAVRLLRSIMEGCDREEFHILGLDARGQPIGTHLVSVGSLNGTQVHPREVFKAALMMNAASIILAHCHPSGMAWPSADDEKVTEKLREAGELMGVPVVDHIIIGVGTATSVCMSELVGWEKR